MLLTKREIRIVTKMLRQTSHLLFEFTQRNGCDRGGGGNRKIDRKRGGRQPTKSRGEKTKPRRHVEA